MKWIFTFADVTDCLARWRLRPSKFDFNVVYRAGTKHQAADTLSRLAAASNDQTPIEDDLLVVVLGTSTENSPRVCLVTDMTTLVDEADIRVKV